MRCETIIGVKDVSKSSSWYQSLLGCKSNHGGNTFEILVNEENTAVLYLHKWGEHDHPTLVHPGPKPGNGLILYFRVKNLHEIWVNAKNLNALIESAPAINENSGEEEFSLRDPDGYFIIISR